MALHIVAALIIVTWLALWGLELLITLLVVTVRVAIIALALVLFLAASVWQFVLILGGVWWKTVYCAYLDPRAGARR